jgi:NAD(P)-dependent dehydrogenase (short-subunit alcohol dehydrogenase family)
MSGKIWFITGASLGFGCIWAEAALRRKDKVAATARVEYACCFVEPQQLTQISNPARSRSRIYRTAGKPSVVGDRPGESG